MILPFLLNIEHCWPFISYFKKDEHADDGAKFKEQLFSTL